MSGVSIKVAIRCRPFTNDDKLGVVMHQSSDEEGEIELINCDYSNTRFPFTYAWWSAYGYERHLKGVNMKDADSMQLINQDAVYARYSLTATTFDDFLRYYLRESIDPY